MIEQQQSWMDTPHFFGGLSRRGWGLIFGLLFLCVLYVSLIGPDYKPCHYDRDAHEKECAVDGLQFVPAAIRIGWWFLGDNDKPILAIATIVLAIFTYKLWRDSADGVQKTIATMDKNAHRELRAYVAFTGMETDVAAVGKNAVKLTCAGNIFNFGKTPARAVEVTSGFRVRPRVISPNDWVQRKRPDGDETRLTLMPGDTRPGFASDVTLTDEQIEKFRAPGAVDSLYFIAQVDYRDVFSDEPRCTEWCQRLRFDSEEDRTTTIQYVFTETHNDAT